LNKDIIAGAQAAFDRAEELGGVNVFK